jgi:hypothetical protein
VLSSVLSQRPHNLGRLAAPALLLIVVALAGLQASQPLHLHHGASAGLYDEEHVLAALDSVTGDAPLPDSVPSLAIEISTDRGPLAASDGIPAPAARSSAPRAPPLA